MTACCFKCRLGTPARHHRRLGTPARHRCYETIRNAHLTFAKKPVSNRGNTPLKRRGMIEIIPEMRHQSNTYTCYLSNENRCGVARAVGVLLAIGLLPGISILCDALGLFPFSLMAFI